MTDFLTIEEQALLRLKSNALFKAYEEYNSSVINKFPAFEKFIKDISKLIINDALEVAFRKNNYGCYCIEFFMKYNCMEFWFFEDAIAVDIFRNNLMSLAYRDFRTIYQKFKELFSESS